MMKKEENLESPLLSNGEPAPADSEGSAYPLVCALLASLTSIIFGYSKLASAAGFFFFFLLAWRWPRTITLGCKQRVPDLSPACAHRMQTAA